jgi:hypothetical protein
MSTIDGVAPPKFRPTLHLDIVELNRLGADNPAQTAPVPQKNPALEARTLAASTEDCLAAPSTNTRLLSCLIHPTSPPYRHMQNRGGGRFF